MILYIYIYGRQYRSFHGICIKNTQRCRKKLFAAGQGGSRNNVWIEVSHKQLYGRCFVIMTDHKPLVLLFGELNKFRLQRYAPLTTAAITVPEYKYKSHNKAGRSHANPPFCSRVPKYLLTQGIKKRKDCHNNIHDHHGCASRTKIQEGGRPHLVQAADG